MLDHRAKHRIHFIEPIPSLHSPGGQLSKPVRAVLFDIYGTLFVSDSGDIGIAQKQAHNLALLGDLCRHYGIDVPPDQVTQRLFQSIRMTHERIKQAGITHPEIKIDAVWQDILGWQDHDRIRDFALEYEWAVNPSYPMPGLDETLRTIRRRSLVMGLISNAQFFTPLLFEWFLGAAPTDCGFMPDLTVYSYQCGEAKPSETLFLHCADKLSNMGLPPESVVYVGNDMLNDIVPAAKMGWQTVLFAGDHRSLRLRRENNECRLIHPNLVITNLRQLLDWI